MKIYFDHEKLDVYREAVAFCGWAGDFLSVTHAKAAAKDQLDRASTSVPLNITEGNGKIPDSERARSPEIARGSALECAACLDVMQVRGFAAAAEIEGAKEQLSRIVAMLMGMLRRFSSRPEFVREEENGYGLEREQEREQEHEEE